jgi:hypothetical protein
VTAFLGIDPGAKGAIACLEGGLINIEDFPRHSDGSMDHFKLAAICSRFDFARFALIEDVHAMPHDGRVSLAAFMQNFGAWKQALSSAMINWRAISAKTWKRQLGVTADKATSIAMAERLYPQAAGLLRGERGGLKDGRAEALLLAHLAKQTWKLEGKEAA